MTTKTSTVRITQTVPSIKAAREAKTAAETLRADPIQFYISGPWRTENEQLVDIAQPVPVKFLHTVFATAEIDGKVERLRMDDPVRSVLQIVADFPTEEAE